MNQDQLGFPLGSDADADGDQLPMPPLRLRRIRLHGVGPDGARFDPLDLNFTTRDGAAARVLLSLTNTGGKSTLITLLCSLIVPAARAQVGGKVLGDYVLTGDTSHVVCEWEDATTHIRTVIGTVMEWKDGRRQPAHKQRSTTNMHRAWYLFRTGPGLPGIDDLPFITEGRRTTYDAFVNAIDALLTPHPAAQWILIRKTQQDWTTALQERTSIDPVLFSYQMRMNDTEAGAERLLDSFDTPDNIVRFFVAALNDDRELADYTTKLAGYAALAAKRPELEQLSAFGLEVCPRIETIAQRASDATAATAAATQARTRGGEFTAALGNRIAQDQAALDELVAVLSEATEAAASARREYGQISDIKLQLTLEDARAHKTIAEDALWAATSEAADARADARAWDAVDAVLEVEVRKEERAAARVAYGRADAGLTPLREHASAAAAALAGRLEGLAEEAKLAAQLADDTAEHAEQAREAASEIVKAADRSLHEATRGLEKIDATIRAAEDATAAAISAGWLAGSEHPQRCLQRWQNKHEGALAAERTHKAAADAADSALDLATAEIERLDDKLVPLRAAAEALRTRLKTLDVELADLAANETVVSLLEAAPVTHGDIERADGMARRAAEAADTRYSTHEARARIARDELAHLDATGTAPTGDDVHAVLTVLIDAGIGASTGVEWIERNIAEPGDRPAVITARPELAGGVVVTDPTRFDSAVQQLYTASPRLRTPITVTTAPAPASHTDTTRTRGSNDSRHVVLPHRAIWDRAWAATTRAELERVVLSESEIAERAKDAAARYRAVSAQCSAFVSRWAGVQRSTLASEVEAADSRVTQAAYAREDARTRRDSARASAAAARALGEQARDEADRARRHLTDATALVEQHRAADDARSGRATWESTRAAAERDRDDAIIAGGAAKAEFTTAIEAAAQYRANRQQWQRERYGLGVEQAASDPGGNLEVVRAAWSAARHELAAAERGLLEAELLDRAERSLSTAIGRLEGYDAAVRARSEQLACTTAASAPESRVSAQRHARDLAERTESTRLRKKADLEAAAAAVRAAEPSPESGHQNHFDLSHTPEWLPSSAADIPAIFARLEIHNARLRERRDQAELAEREARELHDAVTADVVSFTDTIAMWPADQAPTNRVFDGAKEAAREELRALLEAHKHAENAERTAQEHLRDAVANARAVANDPRWKDLHAPGAVRVRSLRDTDLVAESEQLARRISAMTQSAASDLADMDTHRAILRDGLFSLCREQHRLLREVSRSSRLPAGLGELTGQASIKIRFDTAPAGEASVHLATRIDAWAIELGANPKRASSAEVRTRWLADAVRDTVVNRPQAGPWSIEILKPRIDGKIAYCPPDRIRHEFSGGQVLTLAVLVYCALSGVRSAHRPGGARPPGALILDNPFGAASAETLIAMQHRLAAHTGLQLVCATGLHDAGVDAAFTGPGSVIIKLRNDGDLRRNLSFLRLRATVVDGIDIAAAVTSGRPNTATQNWVDAAGYEITP